jgi:hypothetical protein
MGWALWKPGWSLVDAVDLVRQGYSVGHAAKVTGWAASVIRLFPVATNWAASVIAAQAKPRRTA